MNIYDTWLCTKYIAHRGLHDENSPENSLSAYKKAIEKDYAIELDVRCLADGTVVCFHDERLGRLTGHDGFISNYTYDDIKDLTLLKSKEHIPTFDEVLKLVNGQVPLLIEIKNSGKVGFEKYIWKSLSKYKGEYAVQSFNPYSLEWFKINAPHVKRGQLSSYFKNEDMSFIKKYTLKRMMLNKKVSEPNFISYNLEDLPNKYVKKYSNIPLIGWTIRDAETFIKARKCCDNVIFENVNPEELESEMI